MKAQLFRIDVFRLLNIQSVFVLRTILFSEKKKIMNNPMGESQRWIHFHTTCRLNSKPVQKIMMN